MESTLEDSNQLVRLLQPDTDANQIRIHSETGRPVQFLIVRQHNIGRGKRKVGAQTRPLGRLNRIVKRNRIRLAMKHHTQQAAVAARGQSHRLVVGPGRRAVLGVVHRLDGRVVHKHLADGLGIAIHAVHARGKVPAVALHENRVLGPVRVLVLGVGGGLEGRIVPTRGVEHGRPAHDVAVAGENLGQAADHDVGVLQDVDIGKRTDGLVDDDGEVILVGQGPDALQVRTEEQRVPREFAKEAEEALPGLEAALQIVQVVLGGAPVKDATRTEFLEDLEGVDVGKSEADALQASTGVQQETVCVEDGVHAAGEEVDVIFRQAGDATVAGLDLREGMLAEVDVFGEGSRDAPPDGRFGPLDKGNVQVAPKPLFDEAGGFFRIGHGAAAAADTVVIVVLLHRLFGCGGGGFVDGSSPLLVAPGPFALDLSHRGEGGLVAGIGDEQLLGEKRMAELGTPAGDAVATVLPVLFGVGEGLREEEDGRDGGIDGFQGGGVRGGGIKDQVKSVKALLESEGRLLLDEGYTPQSGPPAREQHGLLAGVAKGIDDSLAQGLDAVVDEESWVASGQAVDDPALAFLIADIGVPSGQGDAHSLEGGS